jgi:flagellar protein FliJ
MRSLDSLIRLNKFQLDDKKRRLADIRLLTTQIGESLALLEAELEREQAVAAVDPALGASFTAYRASAAARRTSMLESIARLEEEIESINEEILSAFQDLKRYETARDERLRVRTARRTKTEEDFAAEISLRRAGMKGH